MHVVWLSTLYRKYCVSSYLPEMLSLQYFYVVWICSQITSLIGDLGAPFQTSGLRR